MLSSAILNHGSSHTLMYWKRLITVCAPFNQRRKDSCSPPFIVLRYMNHKITSRTRILSSIKNFCLTLIASLLMVGCGERTTAVSITGYNHTTDISISEFYVNGVMGPNVDSESGGAETCCVAIPTVWRPGLAVKIWWKYDGFTEETTPASPSAEIAIPIPEYKVPGRLQVHFYREKIKIVVSPCSPQHPFYPMTKDDLAPWKASSTKESMAEAAKRGGGSVEC
ncbi:DUF3304 domain-containing protein [Massilia buxea]|uniref:DUF3304 domain-containing protein n=2 Tax=Pseudoduganella buxea TaxID=1949069 RepID=A0A6I3SZ94_9BURK|nr:DUF3304 domain-containing protein [Pseudoduganella buxea]